MNNLTKYEFVEGKNNIPENQFGLGYTNIIMIVADIIDYIESSEKSFNSNINLISIEEPETYMHPQMQEMFIKNIENMIKAIFNNRNKNLNLQIIITTHSSHILNSKIHFGNTFNDINYVYDTNNSVEIIKLSDKEINEEFNRDKSYEMQCKINKSKKKSEFSNQILMKLLLNEEADFVFPEYIENGLNALLKKLGGGENE